MPPVNFTLGNSNSFIVMSALNPNISTAYCEVQPCEVPKRRPSMAGIRVSAVRGARYEAQRGLSVRWRPAHCSAVANTICGGNAEYRCLPVSSNISPLKNRKLDAIMRILSIAAFVVVSMCSVAHAQDERAGLVLRIANAQGLNEIFEQQLTQQRDSTKVYVQQLYQRIILEAGGQENPKALAAFERFVAKTADIFTAQELSTAWVSVYGSALSIDELKRILSYYESPIGKKDVAAAKLGMQSFGVWAAQLV